MQKVGRIFLILFLIFFYGCSNTVCNAEILDEIEKCIITVEPRFEDGTLDITYEYTWKVLNTNNNKPLNTIIIGTSNEAFTNIQMLSENIKKIKKGGGATVKVELDQAYYAGDVVTFKYSIHQPYMYKLAIFNAKYEFTAPIFDNVNIKQLTIRWNKDGVDRCDSNVEDENYYIWSKSNLELGKSLTAYVEYKKSEFIELDDKKEVGDEKFAQFFGNNMVGIVVMIIFMAIFAIAGDGGYSSHRGFGSSSRGTGGGRSSCACARSCACACAGSGRAGCSKKDFYGIKLERRKLNKVLK